MERYRWFRNGWRRAALANLYKAVILTPVLWYVGIYTLSHLQAYLNTVFSSLELQMDCSTFTVTLRSPYFTVLSKVYVGIC